MPFIESREWNTPRLMQAGLLAVFVLSLLLTLAAISGARSHRRALQAVGRDSAPSIIAARHIRAALADMDANAANELLDPAHSAAALKLFESRRVEAANAIIVAAKNITYGDAEEIPIRQLVSGMGVYSAQMQSARDFKAASSERFLDAYRAAAATMDTVLLPAAAALDKANRDALDAAYAAQKSASSQSFLFLAMAAALAAASLVSLQLFLSTRTRRTFNPMLIAATLAVVIFAFYTAHAFQGADQELKIAKEDAFESIHALWLARSLSYSANSDESRYLLDAARAAAYENDFSTKVRRIANLPVVASESSFLRTLNAGKPVAGFTGYLADELNNITFPGERDAAVETLTRYFFYLAVDKQIRALETSGQHARAVALCVGSAEGQSDWAFNRFDESLGRTLDVNQTAFDAAVARGFADLSNFEVIAPLAALLIAALSWLGLRPRLREYS